MGRGLERWVFLLSAAFLLFLAAFSYGYSVAKNRRFPHRLIVQASDDLEAVVDLFRANAHVIHSSRKQGGVTIHNTALTQPGLTFLTAYDGERFRPFLIDIEGRVVHRWTTIYSVVFQGKKEFSLLWDSRRFVHGAHLYPDGSILVNLHLGLAKLDRCSRPIWVLRKDTHHSILPLPDGSFWTLSVDSEKKPHRPHMANGRREETLLHVSADGRVLEEINVIDAILKGGYHNVLLQGDASRPENELMDPLHLNDIEVVTNELAQRVPKSKAGDLLISLQRPGALAIIGRDTRAVVWSLMGPFLRQHDPDIFDDGTLLVFDNRTEAFQRTPIHWLEEPQAWGYSRILRIDPATQQVLWSFEGSKAFPFYTSAQGKSQLLANGDILVTDPEGGRAFEIAPAHGNEVVWEYVNKLGTGDDGDLGRITQASRFDFDGSQFLNLPCP